MIDPPARQPTIPPSNTVRIKVPSALTHVSFDCIGLVSSQTHLIALAGWVCLGAQGPVEVPLGGRRKIVPYRAAGDTAVYLVPEPDPQARSTATTCPSARSAAPSTPPIQPATNGVIGLSRPQPTTVTFDLSAPSVPNAADPGGKLAAVPLVSEEGNCFDPDQDPTTKQGAFYLRGVRLPNTGETATVTATVTDPGALGPSATVSKPLKVTVRREDLGDVLTPDIENAVVDAASKTGVPPQFLKAQIKHENGFLRDTLYRYEPLTQDFNFIGWEQASDRGNVYLKRHMFAGTAVSGDAAAPCVALAAPGVDAAAVQQVCSRIVAVPAGATVVSVGETGIVRARSGWSTWPATYHTGMPQAELNWTPDFQGPPERLAGTMTYKDPPHYSVAGGAQAAAVGGMDFQYDYVNNTVKLGSPLHAGEWVKLGYRRMNAALATVPAGGQPGACAASLPGGLSFFDGKAVCVDNVPKPLLQAFSTISQPATISNWFGSNAGAAGACRGYNWISGNDSERHLEFLSGANPARVLDRRLEQATAQFLAAGSFGILQFTPARWEKADADILNKVFDLKTGHCIYELADPNNADRVKLSVLLAAAAHSAVKETKSLPALPTQVDWANYWADIIQPYNGGPGYGSSIVTDGLKKYSPK